MAKISVGSVSTFNHEVQDWSVYKERLEQWFLANEITDTEDKAKCKRRAILLSSLTENTYKLLRDLALPSQVGTLDYDNLVKLLDGHLISAKCGFAERYNFYSSTQRASETLAEWAARVRGLAVDCGFQAASLKDTLRDRFVLGMLPGPEREKLFTMELDELSFTNALELAERIRCARLGASQAVPSAASALPPGELPVYKMAATSYVPRSGRPGGGAAAPKDKNGPQVVCAACGYEGHEADSCKFSRYKCGKCGLKGHLRRVCPGKKVLRQNFIECDAEGDVGDDDGKRTIFHIRSCRGEPMQVSVIVQDHDLLFEIDTGSAVTVISDKIYNIYFSNIALNHSQSILQSYNGSNIATLGTLNLPFAYNNKTVTLQVYVVRDGGPSLVGRDFIGKFNLEITAIKKVALNNYLDKAQNDYPKLFSGQLGCCKGIKVELNLKPDSQPKFFKARTVPFALRKKVELEIDRLVCLGILVPVSHSDYASPVVPVLKHDGSIRLCADYSVSLNKQLIIEKYPLPRIEELFSKLHGGQQFSKLDLSRAYNQLVLNKKSQLLTTINTIKGLFKFTRLVFGLSSAAAIFQRTLENILSGLEGVLVFQDDILVTGRDESEHLTRLYNVFRRLEQAGLVLQKDKCMLFQDSVSYLGFKIDRHGLHKCHDKIDAIINAKTPTNINELKSFLGMVNYYRMFVENAATILEPLHCLLRKNVPWRWGREHDVAVSTIKRELISEKTLAHFNADAKLILTVDAGPGGLGAILSQIGDDGLERPVAYASRSLSAAEKGYSQIQKEATAIIYGVRKYHHYLYGRASPFVLRTDHKPLLSIFSPEKGIPEVTANRLQRYAIYLMSYNFVLEYVSSAHNAADYLSRSASDELPCAGAGAVLPTDKASYVNFIYGGDPLISIDEIGKQTLSDANLSVICKYVRQGWPVKVSDEIKPYLAFKNELSFESSCLVRGHKIIIPPNCQNKILSELHIGHLGCSKMKAEARNRFWWPRMSADIENFVAACDVCRALRPAPARVPLTPWPYPPRPWYRVHMDLLGPINNRVYLIIVDAHSKWVECFDVSSGYSSRVIIEKVCETMSRFGLFNTICTDNGTSFVSAEFEEFCLINSIAHLTSPTYNPSSNGQAESYVKIVKKALKSIIMTGVNQRAINSKLYEFLFRYRNSEHSTTGRAPAEILFGHKIRSRLDTLTTHQPTSSDASLEHVVKNRQSSQCRYYKGNRSVSFAVNEIVLVKMYKQQKNYWSKGVIINQVGNNCFMVQLLDSNTIVKKHVNQLLKLKGKEATHECDQHESNISDGGKLPTEMPAFILSPSTSSVETGEEVAPEQCAATAPASVERSLSLDQPEDEAGSAADMPEPFVTPTTSRSSSPEAQAPPPWQSSSPEVQAPPPQRRPRNEVDYSKFF